MSTQELLLAWRDEGQEAAFEALFERYHAPIYRVLYRMVGDEAEDTNGVGWQGACVNPKKVLEREAQRAVRMALRTLSHRQATLLTLRYEGLHYREIATVIDVAEFGGGGCRSVPNDLSLMKI
ncbi:MAG: hypothetical protein R6V13_12175 [Anaerolineae bacterium]